jgi:hypothetical protein
MANVLQMAVVQSILHLYSLQWSRRRIARELRVDRGTVSRYLDPERNGRISNPANASIDPGRESALSNPATIHCVTGHCATVLRGETEGSPCEAYSVFRCEIYSLQARVCRSFCTVSGQRQRRSKGQSNATDLEYFPHTAPRHGGTAGSRASASWAW